MAIAGCDFVCVNKDCAHFDKGITMSGPWPIGDIDLVIHSERVRADVELQKQIQSHKDFGEKYAIISFPNKDNIPKVGVRIQKWCPKCPAIWNYNVLNKGEVAIEEPNETCFQCKEVLLDFDEVIKQGILCPHCKKEMQQRRWTTNE